MTAGHYSTVIVGYPAEWMARHGAGQFRGRRSVSFDGRGCSDVTDAAAHAAATRSAAIGAAAAAVVAFLATIAAASFAGDDPSAVLAAGAAVALTGAPFGGGLAGFAFTMHRWLATPTTVVAWDPSRPAGPAYAAIRTTRPNRVRAQLLDAHRTAPLAAAGGSR